MVLFSHRGIWFLLDCPFDDALDDYQDIFGVYQMKLGLMNSGTPEWIMGSVARIGHQAW